ncbi:glucuronate isomerase [Synoicihabitans lomoniglobus]|uniref:Uronate isomerase n=1 Tax=Synoicihabitans lomoniglobus TaxID=2909285 RepID=A0AAE9ZS86_9BACT|nr:glucuronate isomerase [Opitutaceae bacterium LMO-M01]WED63252.1 glucuronate isomerase [Opitutaceae bacterium LMO-M01]
MRPYIHDDFMLHSDAAVRLYHDYAAAEPIFDYHNHLPHAAIADDHVFADLAEIWLGGDHYKWRAMRANGVAERFCTGDASPFEKFEAWAATVPQTLRNPLYHWTHLELKRYFGIDTLLGPETAREIWDTANTQLAGMSVQSILRDQKVAVAGTTDDPADSLATHQRIAALNLSTKVYPTFRPDKAYALADPAAFNAYCAKLGATAGRGEIASFDDLLAALEQRHADFHAVGGRLSDHGLETALAEPCTLAEARAIFLKVRDGNTPSPEEQLGFGSLLMLEFGRWDAKRGWTKQLHLGAMRNNSARAYLELGPDCGFDSIGDYRQAPALVKYLSSLDETGELPKTIVYNLNPADNYMLATLVGNFQDGVTAGKMQFGSGWWFLDQKEAMEWQMNALSNLGLLSRFVGMLTDSRSFMSFPRHEYFRRTLCNLLGSEMANGELPPDFELVGGMVKNICFANARNYFGLAVDPSYSG